MIAPVPVNCFSLTSLSPSKSDIQTEFDTSMSNTDLSPSISNDQSHDQLSRSQLCKEQHSDPEISPLFERALDENEISLFAIMSKMTF